MEIDDLNKQYENIVEEIIKINSDNSENKSINLLDDKQMYIKQIYDKIITIKGNN
jgi:hypothetical protein